MSRVRLGEANIRWACYAHPLTVEARWAIDGNNAGFMAWNSRRLLEWREAAGKGPEESLSAADHAAYDSWLIAKCEAES